MVTRALGEAAERLGQSASVGELLAGMMLALAVTLWGDDIAFLAAMAGSEALDHTDSNTHAAVEPTSPPPGEGTPPRTTVAAHGNRTGNR